MCVLMCVNKRYIPIYKIAQEFMKAKHERAYEYESYSVAVNECTVSIFIIDSQCQHVP